MCIDGLQRIALHLQAPTQKSLYYSRKKLTKRGDCDGGRSEKKKEIKCKGQSILSLGKRGGKNTALKKV